jgi:hypothetical protein
MLDVVREARSRPRYHFINFRDPLLHDPENSRSWEVCVCYTVFPCCNRFSKLFKFLCEHGINYITQAGVTCSRSLESTVNCSCSCSETTNTRHETLKGGMFDNPPLVMLLAQAVSMRCNVEEVKGGSGPA